MRDFFFQILLFIAGALVGVAVPLVPKRGQKLIAGIFAVLLVSTSLVWLGYELTVRGVLPTPTISNPTPISQVSPEPSDTDTSPTPQPNTPSITIWVDPTQINAVEARASEFESEYDVTIELQEVAFGDIRNGVVESAGDLDSPDIVVGSHDWLGELVTKDLIRPIDLGNKRDEFIPASLQAFSYEGILYGVPYTAENVALFRNIDLVPEAPESWNDVRQISENLITSGDARTGYALWINDAFHFFPIQTAFGGYLFGLHEDGSYDINDLGIDSEGTVTAATWVYDMVADGLMEGDLDWDSAHTMFETGEAAMIITGPWALDRFRDSGVNYAISDLPLGTTQSRPFIAVQGFMISASSSNPELSNLFLTEFIATQEAMQDLQEINNRPSAYISVAESISDPDLVALQSAGENGLPMPSISEMAQVWGPWSSAVTAILQQEDKPEGTFIEAATEIRDAISN